MPVESVTFSNFQKRELTKNNAVAPVTPKEKHSSKSKIYTGIGLTCLAAGGVYIATGRTQNVTKVFEKVKNTDSIMDVLKNSKLSKKNFKELLFKITSEEETSEKFIKEVTSNPRESKKNTEILKNKIGGANELLDWAIQPNGYQNAYSNYARKVYNEAQKTDDLIGISPNWNVWAVKNKFGKDFMIGELPKEIDNIKKYRDAFIEGLKNEKAGVQSGNIVFGDYIGGGLSGKSVRRLSIGDKQYIMKFQPPTYHENLADDISMKSDSAFLDAQLERYLQLHDYQQGPKLKFYDNKTHSTLYELSEGEKPSVLEICDIVKTNKRLGDLNELGVYYNDLNPSNFLKNDKELTFIDSGESSYVDFFKPGVSALHFSLPNLNGRSITDSAAAIQLAK